MLNLPDGSTISSGMLVGSPQDLEITAHINAAIATANTHVQLDQQITVLQIKQAVGSATDDDIKQITTLQAQQQANILAGPDPTATTLTTPTGQDVALSMVKANFIATSTTPPPRPPETDTTQISKAVSTNKKLKATPQTTGQATTLPQIPQAQVNGLNGSVNFPTIDPNDLYTYVVSTCFLNPWGRNRQCDEDIKNLNSFIQADILNELGEWVACGKSIANSATQ